MQVIGIWLWLSFSFLSCASDEEQIAIESIAGSSEVFLVNPEQAQATGQSLGKTPLKLSQGQVKGKVLLLQQEGKVPQHWVFMPLMGEKLTLKPVLKNLTEGASASAGKGSDPRALNQLVRTVLKAYEAVLRQEFQVAHDLADTAMKLNPQLAAPALIKGLAFLQEGKNQQAAAMLKQAQALAPDDSDISVLLEQASGEGS